MKFSSEKERFGGGAGVGFSQYVGFGSCGAGFKSSLGVK